MENNGKKWKKNEIGPGGISGQECQKGPPPNPLTSAPLRPFPATSLPPSLAPMIGTHGALYRRPQQFGARSAKQYVWSAEKTAPATQEISACGVKNRRLQHRNMAHAVLELDIIPIMSCILLCAHLRAISLYRCPSFLFISIFVPLLQSFEKPCY